MKICRRNTMLFLLALAHAGIASAAGPDAAKTPIRIGVSLSLTGTYAEFARLQQYAYQLFESQINSRGGILHRPVKFVIRDDGSDPQTAIKIYEQFTEHDKLEFVVSPFSSRLTAAVVPVAEKNGYPMLAGGASSDELWMKGYKNLFGVYSPNSRYVMGFLALLAQSDIKSIAIVALDDNSMLSIAEGTKRWAPDYGIQVTDYRVIPKKGADFEAAAMAARQSRAQALVITGYIEESTGMRRALTKIGWSPQAFYAHPGPNLDKYHEVLGADAQGTFFTTMWEPREDVPLPGSADFLRAYRERFKVAPSYHAANAYAACQILEKAILKVGSIEPVKVRQALMSLETNTIIGRYAVDRTGQQVKHFPMIVQWQGAKREIVWPEDVSTAKPILKK